jgi:UDPglucose 6-dehydrogenase
VESVVAVNDARKAGMAMRVVAACRGSVRGKTIGVLGLTFKPETDDMRDAPSIPIIARLIQDGATLRVFDPKGMDQAKSVLPSDVIYCRDAMDAATGADALVLITEWNEFRALSPACPVRRQLPHAIPRCRSLPDQFVHFAELRKPLKIQVNCH